MIVIEDRKLYYQQVPVYISYLQVSTKAGQHQNPCTRESFARKGVKNLPKVTNVILMIPASVTVWV